MTRRKRGKMAKVKTNPKASPDLQGALDVHLGRTRGRRANPRNSKVKDALAAEATRFRKFEDFAKAYWDACARGLYWYATDEKRFHIGEPERRQIAAGRFSIACSPELALAGKNEGKKYVAELDVTRVPGDSIRLKRGAQGSEVKVVGSPGSVKVTRVLDADAATRSFQWQLSILPSSKEGLRKVWERAWERRRKQDAVRAAKLKREKEREAKRGKAQQEKDEAAAERLARKKEREAKRRKAARAAEGRQARKAAEAKRGSKKVSKKTTKKTTKKTAKKAAKKAAKKKTAKKGTWKRVARAPNPKSPSKVARKIPSHINNPGC